LWQEEINERRTIAVSVSMGQRALVFNLLVHSQGHYKTRYTKPQRALKMPLDFNG
jgi:hypothetical protein